MAFINQGRHLSVVGLTAAALMDLQIKIQGNIPVPSAYTPDGSQIEIKILYSTDTNSGNVIGYLSSARTAIGENAEDGTSSGSSPFHSTAASTTANYLTESTANNITVATGTRMIHFYFGRNGTSGSDTCTGNMHIYGIEVIW